MVFGRFGECEKAVNAIKEDGKVVSIWGEVTAPGLVTSKELWVYYFCYSIMDNL